MASPRGLAWLQGDYGCPSSCVAPSYLTTPQSRVVSATHQAIGGIPLNSAKYRLAEPKTRGRLDGATFRPEGFRDRCIQPPWPPFHARKQEG